MDNTERINQHLQLLSDLQNNLSEPYLEAHKEFQIAQEKGMRDQIQHLFKISTITVTLAGLLLGIDRLKPSECTIIPAYYIGIAGLLGTAFFGIYVGIIMHQKYLNDRRQGMNEISKKDKRIMTSLDEEMQSTIDNRSILESTESDALNKALATKANNIIKNGLKTTKIDDKNEFNILDYGLDFVICIMTLSFELIIMGMLNVLSWWGLAVSILVMMGLFYLQQKLTGYSKIKK